MIDDDRTDTTAQERLERLSEQARWLRAQLAVAAPTAPRALPLELRQSIHRTYLEG